jgi:16S rRNA (cytidine1402-2'-O)-methyltransferase
MATLSDFLEFLGNRKIAVCRELTKKFEEILRCDIKSAIEHFEHTPPKGEFVLIIEGADKNELLKSEKENLPSPEELLKSMASESLYGKDLVKAVASALGMPKREVYEIYLKMEDKI